MKKILLVSVITCFYAMATGQSFYTGELSKTMGTNYGRPALGLSYGYKQNILVGEAGIKTNYNEYYTMVFGSLGIESKGKLLVGANAGLGITFNIPQLDRQYFPETGEIKIISDGYESKSITSFYGNLKVGYEVIDRMFIYSSYSIGFMDWASIGIRLTFF